MRPSPLRLATMLLLLTHALGCSGPDGPTDPGNNGGDAGVADGGGTIDGGSNNDDNIGGLGEPYAVGATCDEGLVCQGGTCLSPDAEPGSLGGPCRMDGSCNTALVCNDAEVCVEATVPDGLTLDVTPPETYVRPNGEIELKARVFDADGNLLFNRTDAPIVVEWTSSDPDVATVDERGVVRAIDLQPVTVTAQVRGSDATFEAQINPGTETLPNGLLPAPQFTDVQEIFVDPPRVALDIGSSRNFNVSAVDQQGSPTSLDCGSAVNLEHEAAFYDANYDGATGAETISAEGVAKGFSLMTLDCNGLFASPVVVEVKPSVTIPNPAPNGESDFGVDLHFALDGTDIHLVSYDQQNGKLVYTAFDGVWQSEYLDGEGDYGQKPRVVLDPLNNDQPLVCANESGALVCWTKNNAGFWIKQTVDPDGGTRAHSFDMIAQPDGTIAALYSRAGSLWLASSSAATRDDWQLLEVTDADTTYSALALASDGTLRAAYMRENKAWYAHASEPGSEVWFHESIDGSDGSPAGQYIRLALAANNQPQVAYYKNDAIVRAVRSGGQWGVEIVEPTAVNDRGFGFGLDRHYQPRISYFDASAQELRHAYYTGERWRIDSPLARSTTARGSYNHMVIDDFGRAQIAYYDDENGEAGLYVEPHFLDYRDVSTSNQESPDNLNVASCQNACAAELSCLTDASGVTCGRCNDEFCFEDMVVREFPSDVVPVMIGTDDASHVYAQIHPLGGGSLTFDPGNGLVSLSDGFLLVSYDSSLNLRWSVAIEGVDSVHQARVDGDGRTFLVGTFSSSVSGAGVNLSTYPMPSFSWLSMTRVHSSGRRSSTIRRRRQTST